MKKYSVYFLSLLFIFSTSLFAQQEDLYCRTIDALSVRTSPETNAKVVGVLNRGDIINVVGRQDRQVTIQGKTGTWIQIYFPEGQTSRWKSLCDMNCDNFPR